MGTALSPLAAPPRPLDSAPELRLQPGSRILVGARFPRRPSTYRAEFPAGQLRRVFPVGARFPRRSPAESAERELDYPGHPVARPVALKGARFPRRRTPVQAG